MVCETAASDHAYPALNLRSCRVLQAGIMDGGAAGGDVHRQPA
jgi:hypothetical protein